MRCRQFILEFLPFVTRTRIEPEEDQGAKEVVGILLLCLLDCFLRWEGQAYLNDKGKT